jgi:hypothetical protein
MCVWVGVGKLSLLPPDFVFWPQHVSPILWPKNLTKYLYTQSVQNLSSTETWLQKSVVTKPYVETSHMSNQLKSEFVDDIFPIQSFWGGHGKISPKTWFIQDGAICPEMLIQQPVEFPTVVTHKSLTVWSHLMDHQKFERVVYWNGIRDFRRFGKSEIGNWRSVLPLFCPGAESSSDVDNQNSITFKSLSGQNRMSNG